MYCIAFHRYLNELRSYSEVKSETKGSKEFTRQVLTQHTILYVAEGFSVCTIKPVATILTKDMKHESTYYTVVENHTENEENRIL